MKQWGKRALCVATAIALLASGAQARITRIDIVKSEPAFGGASFGEAGAYVHLVGRVSGELDPADPANALIQDISLAPRNARGMVEYSTNIEVLKPADLTRGNRVLLFEVNNRGNKLAVANFNEDVAGTVADRNGLTSPGDGWLMRPGYTLVWWGWEMDVLPGRNRIGMPPDRRPQSDGSPISGIVRSEMIHAGPRRPCRSASVSRSRTTRSIATIRIRRRWAIGPPGRLPAHPDGARPRAGSPMPIANSAWSFGGASRRRRRRTKHVCYPSGFQPGTIYELIYRAKDPLVLGIGFAASRDVGAYLRQPEDDLGAPTRSIAGKPRSLRDHPRAAA